MFLVYMDDSGDTRTKGFSALMIHETVWRDSFQAIKTFRQHLRETDGIYLKKEFHATEFVGGRGNIAPQVVTKWRRCEIFKETLLMVASLKGIRVFNAFGPASDEYILFERFLNRINRTAEAQKSRALIISDEGKEGEYTRLARRMSVFNPIPSRYGTWVDSGEKTKNITLDRIIEDPFFKKSEKSYFIQMADFCAYALLRREVPLESKNRYGLDKAFDLLQPVLFTKAYSKDAMGIIRGR
ncbi:MAG TPA: DUF3800 domain-containing protein [Candidatus Xenobia bacterium]|jgi:hypothetical protein